MQKSEHYGSYPKNINPPIYLAYAFRIFFPNITILHSIEYYFMGICLFWLFKSKLYG